MNISVNVLSLSGFLFPLAMIASGQTRGAAPGAVPVLHVPRTDQAKVIVLDSGAYQCREGLCAVRRNNVWGAIDYQGNVVIDFKYQGQFTFSEGLAAVLLPLTNKTFYIDKQGATAFSPAFGGVVSVNNTVTSPFSDGYARVYGGFLDRQGRFIQTSYAAFLGEFSEGLAWFQPSSYEKTISGGYIGTTMKVAFTFPPGVPPLSMRDFHDGLAWLSYAAPGQTPKWGAVDKTGKPVIAFQFSQEPGPFSDGLAAVLDLNGKLGYIDKTGKLVIPCQFGNPGYGFGASTFINRHALVPVETRVVGTASYALIDYSGSILDTHGIVFLGGIDIGRGLYLFKLSASDGRIGVMTGDGSVLFFSTMLPGRFPDDPTGLAWTTATIGGKTVEGFINRSGDFVVIRGQSQF
jgi:hypothetical protein